MVITNTHNLCSEVEIKTIMYSPVNPSFTIHVYKSGIEGGGHLNYIGAGRMIQK